MSKIVQDVRAFRRRMLIGSPDLWVIVEGKSHDRAFYDKVLKNTPTSRRLRVKIRLAEQLSVKGIVAGGKAHALSIHDALEGLGALVQNNGASNKVAVFMLDRDNDDFLGTATTRPHVIRTRSADVEAEIVNNCKLMRAVADSHGLAANDVKRLKRRIGDPPEALAEIWRDWIVLRLIALAGGVEGIAPTAAPSLVNEPLYGPVDLRKRSDLEARLRAALSAADFDAAEERAMKWVDAFFAAGEAKYLLKGRWISHFVEQMVKTHLAGVPMKSGTHADHIVMAGLSGMRLGTDLVDHFEDGLQRVIPSVLGAST